LDPVVCGVPELGGYEFIREIGRGGMGVIHLARQAILERNVAIKSLGIAPDENPDFVKRFLDEARLAAKMSGHTNIVQVFDVVRDGRGDYFIVMEFVDGQTLLEKLRGDSWPDVNEGIRIVAEAAAGLNHAHTAGIVHRDVKPENIMLAHDGTVKMMDFGIAFHMGLRRRTMPGVKLGTPHYMSPEQIEGSKSLDHRSDLYSLGVVLYYLATGRHPFEGNDAMDVARRHLAEVPTPPIALVPGLPEGLSELITKSLEKDPRRRFQSGAEMRRDLLKVMKLGEGSLLPAASAIQPQLPPDARGTEPAGHTFDAPTPRPAPPARQATPNRSNLDYHARNARRVGQGAFLRIAGVLGVLLCVAAAVVYSTLNGRGETVVGTAPGPARSDLAAVEANPTQLESVIPPNVDVAGANASAEAPPAPSIKTPLENTSAEITSVLPIGSMEPEKPVWTNAAETVAPTSDAATIAPFVPVPVPPAAIPSQPTVAMVAASSAGMQQVHAIPALVAPLTSVAPAELAPVIAIAEMRAMGANAYSGKFTVEGIVTFGGGAFQPSRRQFVVQDETGAVLVDDPSARAGGRLPVDGDRVFVEGTPGDYRGMLQLRPTALVKFASEEAGPLPPIPVVGVADLSDRAEAYLVEIHDLVLVGPAANSDRHNSHLLARDGQGRELTIRLDADISLPAALPAGRLSVLRGIVYEIDPFGIVLCPRYPADIVYAPAE